MRRTSTARLLGWQAAIAMGFAIATALSGRGSAAGILFGAGLLGGSLLLQTWATSAAFGRPGRPSVAVAIFTLKLGLLVGVAAFGLGVTRVPPMSFAVGATTLLLAIVVETCYADRSARRASRRASVREDES